MTNKIKLPNGYWTEEVVLSELKKIKEQLGHFPTQKELSNLNQNSLNIFISRYGGVNKFKALLGDKITKASIGFWTEEKIIENIRIVKNKIGHFPSNDELKKIKLNNLSVAICRHGGFNYYRKLCGEEIIKASPNYWNDKVIINDLQKIINKLNHFPTTVEIRKYQKNDLHHAICKNGGINKFRKIFNLEPLIKPNGYWNDNTILKELQEIIKKLEHFPSNSELILLKRCDLQGAINLHGGINKFHKLMGYALKQHSSGYWSEQKAINKLNEIILEIGHFPTQNELKNMDINGEGLIHAISILGGYIKFRNLIGHKLIKNPNGYYDDINILISNLKPICDELKRMPTKEDLKQLNKNNLYNGINKHGGIIKIAKMLGYESNHKPTGYWKNDNNLKLELLPICKDLNHFPSYPELINLKRFDLALAISNHKGAYFAVMELMGYTVSEYDKEFAKKMSYNVIRGKKSENIVKSMIKEYCEKHNITFDCNKKLSKGNVLEFICNTNKKIGVDVTNTEKYSCIRNKWKHKNYHNHLDELWIIVFGEFTEQNYIKWNNESPNNVKIMTIEQFMEEINFVADDIMSTKINMLNQCTFSTKEQLIEQYRIIKTKNMESSAS